MRFLKRKKDNNNLNNNDELDYEAIKEEECGLIIQITEHIIYLYICQDGGILNDDYNNGLIMKDMDDNIIGINGQYITVRCKSSNDIQSIKEKFHLESLGLPMIEIEVKYW